MTGKVISGEQGVTLVEILVAIVILSTVAATILAGTYTLIKGDEMARKRMSADSLARYELEYVKAMNYVNAPWNYKLPGTPPSWDVTHDSLPEGYSDFSVAVSATSLAGYDDDIQKISVVVDYKDEQLLQVDTYQTK